MILPDVKAHVKQQKTKEMVALSYNFHKEYLQNFKQNSKQACILHSILVILSSLILLI